MRRSLAVAAAVAAVGGAGALWLGRSDAQTGAMPADIDIAQGQALYAANCAACHGANLEGQEDWRSPGPDGRLPAPPHDQTGHTWHHPDQVLFSYTKLGGRALMAEQGMEFDSAMPGFGGQLSDQEIWNILGYIKSTWPERIRETQAVRTEGEARSRETKQ